MTARALLLLTAPLALGCNLLLDVGDHELAPADAGHDAAGGAAGAGGSAAAGGGSAAAGGGGAAPMPIVLATGQQKPTTIYVDLSYVYWINAPDGTLPGSIARVDKLGGATQVLASGLTNPSGLRVGSGYVYFTNDVNASGAPVGVFRVAKTGGMPELVDADNLGAGYMAFSKGYLFTEAWASTAPARVRRSSDSTTNGTGGCYPYTSPVVGGRIPGIGATSDHIYFIDSGANAIIRTGFDCGDTPETFAPNQGSAFAITWDQTNIYWATTDTFYALAIATPGGAPVPLATGQHAIAGIDTHQMTKVFTSAGDGTVVRIDAAKLTVLASGQSDPHGIIIDSSGRIFWTNRGGGEIMTLAP